MTFRPRTNTKAAAAAAAAVASFLVVSLWLLGCCSCSSFVIVVRDCQDCRVGFWLLTADGKLLIDLLSLLSFSFSFLFSSFFSLSFWACVSIYFYTRKLLGPHWGSARGEGKRRTKLSRNSPSLRQKDLFLLPRQFGQRSNSFKCVYLSSSRGSTPMLIKNQMPQRAKKDDETLLFFIKEMSSTIPSAHPVNGTAQLSALHQCEHQEQSHARSAYTCNYYNYPFFSTSQRRGKTQ